jgi:ribosome-associated protein
MTEAASIKRSDRATIGQVRENQSLLPTVSSGYICQPVHLRSDYRSRDGTARRMPGARMFVVYHGGLSRFTRPMPPLQFTLTSEYVELHNLLKLMGLADSGGSAKARVAMGDVTVDGKVELRKTCKIRAGQKVKLDGQTIHVRAPE